MQEDHQEVTTIADRVENADNLDDS